jgi:hypothetical protein
LTRTIPKIFVTRFFQLVTIRQFAEAERVLERIKQKITLSERNRGYYQALYGMLLARRNNDDRYAFLTNIDLTDKKELHEYRRDFLRQSEHRLHAEYDRGFFSAWADFMRILPKLDLTNIALPNNNKNRMEKEAEPTEPLEATPKEPMVEEPASAEAERTKPEQSTLAEFSE